ncbi:MAG: hypothetical protein M1370_05960 [Bacteroidetes bacterium]|nr:hypothetical protein [Bacteroidota bacterium]
MANVCSWCGESAGGEFETPLDDMVCAECWQKVEGASCNDGLRPWKPWSAAQDYKYEPMKRTDRF